MTKPAIVVFGANGYIAKRFIELFAEKYVFEKFYGPSICDDRSIDFADDEWACRFNYDLLYEQGDRTKPKRFDAVLFMQGMNPRCGVDEITTGQFNSMLAVNLTGPTIMLQILKAFMNPSCANVFISSIAAKKGSYDPSYAAAKAGISGLVSSFSNAYNDMRFVSLSLGLVMGSPVHLGMTTEFVQKHLEKMGGRLVDVDDVCKTIDYVVQCKSFDRCELNLDCGFRTA